MKRNSHSKKALQNRRELLKSSIAYEDGDFYIWMEENVDDGYSDEDLIDIWLTYHPGDTMIY